MPIQQMLYVQAIRIGSQLTKQPWWGQLHSCLAELPNWHNFFGGINNSMTVTQSKNVYVFLQGHTETEAQFSAIFCLICSQLQTHCSGHGFAPICTQSREIDAMLECMAWLSDTSSDTSLHAYSLQQVALFWPVIYMDKDFKVHHMLLHGKLEAILRILFSKPKLDFDLCRETTSLLTPLFSLWPTQQNIHGVVPSCNYRQ